MTADSLVDWLRAQLDDDEAAAKAATAGPWHWQWPASVRTYLACAVINEEDGDPVTVLDATGEHTNGYVLASEPDKAHIAAWDPARVLAEVAAKRAILAEFQRRDAWLNMKTLVEPARSEATAMRDALVPVLRLLALPYAGRDGWREEWRPQ